MKISRERYDLTEIAREFVANDWGHADTLLGCLREGQIIASINYPFGEEAVRSIPSQYWVDFPLTEFDVLSERKVRKDDPLEFCVKSECLFDEEFSDLKTIAKAAVEHNTSLIPEEIHSAVLAELEIEDFDGFEDWFNLVRIFHQLANELEADDKDYAVFVLHEHWENFSQGYEPSTDKNTKPGKAGKLPNAYWELLFAKILIRIVENQEKSLTKLTGADTISALAQQTLKWAALNVDVVQGTALLKPDRVAKRLSAIEKGKFKM